MAGHVGFTHILMYTQSNMQINEEVLISNKLLATHLRFANFYLFFFILFINYYVLVNNKFMYYNYLFIYILNLIP
jgi:hypothetical protein